MTIKKVSTVVKLDVTNDGCVHVLMHLNVVEGSEVLSTQNHRTMVPPYVSAHDQMGHVNDHLAQMGWPALDQVSLDKVTMFQQLAKETATQLMEEPVAESLPEPEE